MSEPAFPVVDRIEIGDFGTEQVFSRGGLSKRELFAMAAMQGLLANLAGLRREGFRDSEIEEYALLRADALIAALEAQR